MDEQNQAGRLFEYDGTISQLYRIFLPNLLLTIITFGIYRFWAITRNRRYIWSRLSFQGERFAYTGSGGELFIGYLLALLIVAATTLATLGGATLLAHATHKTWILVLGIGLFYIVLLIMAGGAHFSAQRYRLSRTQWHGLHGGMQGSALAYGAWFLLYLIYNLCTLWQLSPWMTLRLAERRINASSFGNARFDFQGTAGKLYAAFLATFVAVIGLIGAILFCDIKLGLFVHLDEFGHYPTQGLNDFWRVMFSFYLPLVIGGLLAGCFYVALVTRHIAGRTTLAGSMRFASTLSGWRLLKLILGNLLIAIGTLGLGYPVILHRSLRVMADTLMVSGTIDPDTLQQNTDAAPRTGEGMLNLLDHGGAF